MKTNKEDMRDFPELEGKLIIFQGSCTLECVRVAGCSYHVGITLVHHKDANDKYVCLHGPLSPALRELFKEKPWLVDEHREQYWDVTFSKTLEMIRKGAFVVEELESAQGGPSVNQSNPICAFEQ